MNRATVPVCPTGQSRSGHRRLRVLHRRDEATPAAYASAGSDRFRRRTAIAGGPATPITSAPTASAGAALLPRAFRSRDRREPSISTRPGTVPVDQYLDAGSPVTRGLRRSAISVSTSTELWARRRRRRRSLRRARVRDPRRVQVVRRALKSPTALRPMISNASAPTSTSWRKRLGSGLRCHVRSC